MSKRFQYLCGLFPVLALAACGGGGRGDLPSPTVQTTSTPTTQTTRSTGPAAEGVPETAPQVAVITPAPRPAPVMPDDFPEPSILLNAVGREITERLGDPDFERQDQGALLWQYRSERCVLDLFLYRVDGRTTVEHLVVRARERQSISDQSCFWSLHPESQASSSG